MLVYLHEYYSYSTFNELPTWPQPISSGHFGANLNFSVSEAERVHSADASTLHWVKDVGGSSLTLAAPPLWVSAPWKVNNPVV